MATNPVRLLADRVVRRVLDDIYQYDPPNNAYKVKPTERRISAEDLERRIEQALDTETRQW